MTHPSPPHALLPWLTYNLSLMDKLKDNKGDARLKVLRQSQALRSWFNQFALNIDENDVIEREVIVTSWDNPCWYAKSIFPASIFSTNSELFHRLKTESLGQVIFSDESVRRVSLSHGYITPQSLAYYWVDEGLLQKADLLWMRKSVFSASQTYFYLFEIFLPDFMEIIK